jgi:hypothetical protein
VPTASAGAAPIIAKPAITNEIRTMLRMATSLKARRAYAAAVSFRHITPLFDPTARSLASFRFPQMH